MTMDDLRRIAQAYENVSIPCLKKYKTDAIIDENKSVKWNREQVKQLNDLYYDELQKARYCKNVYYQTFRDATLNYIVDETSVTSEKANKIFEFVRIEKESNGYDEMLNFLDEVLDLFK